MVPLWSVFSAPGVLELKAGLVLLFAIGVASPVSGLLLLCGFIPLGSIITSLAEWPWRGAQVTGAVAFAVLGGWFARQTVRAERVPPIIGGPLVALAGVIAGSALTIGASIEEAGAPVAGTYAVVLAALRAYMRHDVPYLSHFVALHYLAGLGLVSAVASVAWQRPDVRRRLVRILVIGIAAASALNVLRFAEAVIATGDPVAASRTYLQWLRINTQYGDINAAGSVFAMMLLTGVGLVSTTRGVWFAGSLACTAMIAAAWWLAGSRTAIAAALVTAPLAFGWWRVRTSPPRIRRQIIWLIVALVATVLVFAAVLVLTSSRFSGNADPSIAWRIRVELLARGLRMIGDEPLFGVGVGRFFAESHRYSTPGTFGPENAHNNFVQIAAELGLVGLFCLLWLLVSAFRAVRDSIHAGDDPARDLWLAAGLVAYLLSSLAGHPLIVWEAALPFWIVLGIAAAGSTVPAGGRWAQYLVFAVLLLVLGSLPARLLDHSGAATAPTVWHTDGAIRYRNVGEADTILIRRPTRTIAIPVRLSPSDAPLATVAISVDGLVIRRTGVSAGDWSTIRLMLPKAPGYADRRVELRLEDHAPGSSLLVGRLTLID